MLETCKKSENIVFLIFAISLFAFSKGYIVGVILLFVTSCYFGVKKQLRWHNNLSLYMLAIALLFTPYIVNLLQGSTQFRELDNIARLLFFGIIGAFFLVKKPDSRVVTVGFCISLVIIFIAFVDAQIAGLNRSRGIIDINVIPLTTSVVAIMAFLLPKLNVSNHVIKKIIYVAFMLGVSSIVISQTKGTLLALVCVLAMYSLCTVKQSWKRVSLLWLLMFSSIFITSELTNASLLSRINLSSSNVNQYIQQKQAAREVQDIEETKTITPAVEKNRVDAGSTIVSSSTIRIELWKSTLLLSQEKPFWGYGYDKAKERVLELVDLGEVEGYVKPYLRKNYHFHSIYFDSLGKRGIAGLVSTLLLLLIPLYIFIRNRHNAPEYALSGCLVIVSFIVSGISDMSMLSRMPIIIFGVLVVLCTANVSKPNQVG